jgi:cytochrome c oxidase subunit 2
MSANAKHVLAAIAVWMVLTLIGYSIIAAFGILLLSGSASEQGGVVDHAWNLLTLLSLPVFTSVLAVILYALLRFRSRGEAWVDGPPIRTNTPFTVLWLVASTVLCMFVVIHPGITGVNELRAYDGKDVDLVVNVEGTRFAWFIEYPAQGIKANRELVLPVDAVTRFYVTSRDVIHSFWIPAFRVKIDAVPGMTTSVVATPNRIGTIEQDKLFKLQCAELCGIGHSAMSIPVRVVTEDEFKAWVTEQASIK